MTSMIDVMIRAEDEAAFVQVAHMVGLLRVTASGVAPVPGVWIDTIGHLTTGGETDDEDRVIVPAEVLPGWHVNLRIDPGRLPGWAAVQADWLDRGQPGSRHHHEHTLRYLGVELITGGVATPHRVFA